MPTGPSVAVAPEALAEARIEGVSIKLGAGELKSDEELAAALVSAGKRQRVLRVLLAAPHEEGALMRFMAAAQKAAVNELLLDWGQRTLSLPLATNLESRRFLAWMHEGELYVHDVKGPNLAQATLPVVILGDSVREAALRERLEAKCTGQSCAATLELTPHDGRSGIRQALEAWDRITSGLAGFSFRLSLPDHSDGIPPDVIQSIVRKNFHKFRACYDAGLSRKPDLTGVVRARFTIEGDGKVKSVSNSDSDLPNPEVVSCTLKAFETLEFPPARKASVTVVYPLRLAPSLE